MFQNNLITNKIKNTQFYYGWVVLAISSLGYFFSGPGQTYFTSIFIDSYIKEYGWSRSTVSAYYSMATLIAGLLLVVVGRYADRVGQKKLILLAAALLGAACLWNSFMSSLWMLFLGFFVSRLTGQGAMTLLPSTVVPQWFIRRRAFAFSIMSMGGVIGSALIPPINSWLINSWGWPSVWRLWAGLLWLFFIPIVFVFLYNKPIDLGLLPDGQLADGSKSVEFNDYEEKNPSWSLQEAMKTRAFWGMLYCQILQPIIITGLVFHFVSILNSKGMSSASASFILSLLAVASFPTSLMTSYLLGRVKIHHVTVLIFLLQLAALAILLISQSIQTAVAFAVLQGISMGLQSVCGGVVWPNYFGMKHLGSIRGMIMTSTVIASALGPIPLGLAFDAFGNYTGAIMMIMLLPLVGVFAALISSKPNKNL